MSCSLKPCHPPPCLEAGDHFVRGIEHEYSFTVELGHGGLASEAFVAASVDQAGHIQEGVPLGAVHCKPSSQQTCPFPETCRKLRVAAWNMQYCSH